MPITEELQTDLRRAMRDRDVAVLRALRSALAALANAQAVSGAVEAAGSQHVAGAALGVGAAEVQRAELTEDQQRALIENEATEMAEHSAQLRAIGREQDADHMQRGVEALREALSRA